MLVGVGLAILAGPACDDETSLVADGAVDVLSDALAAHCSDGVRSGDEPHADCGGSCAPCEAGSHCFVGEDCLPGVCREGFCLEPSCTDGVENGAETDPDCGGGSCAGCEAASACVEATDCLSTVCEAGICGATHCADGAVSGDETAADCGGSCDPCVDGEACGLPDDCMSGICVLARCVAPTCQDETVNGDETDRDCGGSCSPCADARRCAAQGDCESGLCSDGRCASCIDGRQDGDETDRDCGGPLCAACWNGEGCFEPADCRSGVCAGNTCADPTCVDVIQNGDESDVDCGGSCDACAAGKACVAETDCASRVCSGTVCAVPACDDGVINGGESDVDCGGATACARCAHYARCDDETDCSEGLCALGKCGTLGECTFAVVSEHAELDAASILALFTGDGHTPVALDDNGGAGVHTSEPEFWSSYTHVVWHKENRVLSATEVTLLAAWLESGGRLLLTGHDSIASPPDPELAASLGCELGVDGPLSTELTVVNDAHAIVTGPFRAFARGDELAVANPDHDQCFPTDDSTQLVRSEGVSKVQVREAIGAGHGIAIYWNGNDDTIEPPADWDGSGGTQPELQDLLRNILAFLCSAS